MTKFENTKLKLAYFIVAFFLAMLGVLPHVLFSIELGELSYLKSAYDEEWYMNSAMQAKLVNGRILSSALLQFLTWLLGSESYTLIFLDLLLPAFVGMASFYFATSLTTRIWLALPVALILPFSFEVFSFSSSALKGGDVGVLFFHQVIGTFGLFNQESVPASYTSYFSVFRSPEPQLSMIFLIAYIGGLFRMVNFGVKSDDNSLSKAIGLLLLMGFMAAFSYVFIFLSILMITLPIICICYFYADASTAKILFKILVFISFVYIVEQIYFLQIGEVSGASMIFDSRGFVLAPSIFLGLAFTVLLIYLHHKKTTGSVATKIALVFFLLPIVILNQQVLTGYMVSTRDWERYINYFLLFVGVAILISSSVNYLFSKFRFPKNVVCSLAFVVSLSFMALVTLSQVQVYNSFLSGNANSVSLTRLLGMIQISGQDVIFLDQAGSAPMLKLRSDKDLSIGLNYNELFDQAISPLDSARNDLKLRLEYEQKLFEYVARTGKNEHWLESILKGEAAAKSGFFLGFLFNIRDYWGPMTDYRKVESEKILAEIPLIIQRYKDFIELRSREKWKVSHRAILLSNQALPLIAYAGMWRLTLINSIPKESVYAYEQTYDQNVRREKVFSVLPKESTKWQKLNPDVVVDLSVEKLQVETDVSGYLYQLGSGLINVEQGSSYEIKISISELKNGISLGVLDATQDKWIKNQKLVDGMQIVSFVSLGSTIRIILTNDNNPAASSAFNLGATELYRLY